MSELKLEPCPGCGKSDLDQWPNESLDASGANVIRCAWCHFSAPLNAWNRRPPQPVTPAGGEIEPLGWIGDFGLNMMSHGGNSKGYTSLYAKRSRSSKHAVYLHPPVADAALVRDAERWRALIGSARIRVLGSAGLHGETDPYGHPFNGYAHIGLELWTKHEAKTGEGAIGIVERYADIAALNKRGGRDGHD